MKRILNWQSVLGLSLIALSALVYYIHFFIFRDAHHIFIYLIGDIAFVFLEVLLVTLIIHRLLGYREKQSMLKKMNMVIGAFFSEVGTELLEIFSTFDPERGRIQEHLIITTDSPSEVFHQLRTELARHRYDIDIKKGNVSALKHFLNGKREFLLSLLRNPNLLEHESFTDVLWAVFHLTEELCQRKQLEHLPDTDYKHLAGDISRAYGRLFKEWISYLQHLKSDYPYLFLLLCGQIHLMNMRVLRCGS